MNTHSGFVNGDSGNSQKVFTIKQNGCSRICGIGVHDKPEWVFTMVRTMQRNPKGRTGKRIRFNPLWLGLNCGGASPSSSRNPTTLVVGGCQTEWISKGKAGTPVELGLRVCVLQDQFGFTLHHQVMQKQIDDQVTVPMAEAAKKKFPALSQVSYDKGFWSPDNLVKLEALLVRPVLPKKGKLSASDKKREYHPEFIRAKRKHSAVESDINVHELCHHSCHHFNVIFVNTMNQPETLKSLNIQKKALISRAFVMI